MICYKNIMETTDLLYQISYEKDVLQRFKFQTLDQFEYHSLNWYFAYANTFHIHLSEVFKFTLYIDVKCKILQTFNDESQGFMQPLLVTTVFGKD